MQAERVSWGGLSAITMRHTDDDAPLRAAIVMCHGFGAPRADMCGLAPPLMQAEPELASGVLWVFPAAPLSLDDAGIPGGRAWWPIDMEELVAAVSSGRLRDLRTQTPQGLSAARNLMLAFIEELKANTGLQESKIVLGGFSQGAMISTDISLHLPSPPAGLCILSGTLLCEDEWRPLASRRGELRVFQSHGVYDPLLPYANSEALRDMLAAGGADVEFVSFPGDHTIPPSVLQKLGGFLKQVID